MTGAALCDIWESWGKAACSWDSSVLVLLNYLQNLWGGSWVKALPLWTPSSGTPRARRGSQCLISGVRESAIDFLQSRPLCKCHSPTLAGPMETCSEAGKDDGELCALISPLLWVVASFNFRVWMAGRRQVLPHLSLNSDLEHLKVLAIKDTLKSHLH